MISSLQRGVLSISIDVEAEASIAAREQRSSEAMVARLLEILAAQQLAATWALPNPASSSVTFSIQAMHAGHEIAIAADSSWAGQIAPRARFGRELAVRAAAARAQGLNLTSLATKAADLGDHYDLAIKHGLTAVRLGSPNQKRAGARRVPRVTPRCGLWTFGVWCWLPGQSRLWPGGGGSHMARAAVEGAIEGPTVAQLAIDLQQMIERGSAALRVLERVLARAAALRRRGQLDVITLGECSDRLTEQCTSSPSRSILRPAA